MWCHVRWQLESWGRGFRIPRNIPAIGRIAICWTQASFKSLVTQEVVYLVPTDDTFFFGPLNLGRKHLFWLASKKNNKNHLDVISSTTERSRVRIFKLIVTLFWGMVKSIGARTDYPLEIASFWSPTKHWWILLGASLRYAKQPFGPLFLSAQLLFTSHFTAEVQIALVQNKAHISATETVQQHGSG